MYEIVAEIGELIYCMIYCKHNILNLERVLLLYIN